MLREEHMDLFGNLSSGVYTADVAVTSSNVAGNIIEIDPTIPNWDAFVFCTKAFDGTSTKLTIKVQGANELSSGSLSNPVTLFQKEIAKADLKNGLLWKRVLDKGFKFFQFTLVPDTTSSAAFTDGKIAGYVVPEFN